MSCLHPYGSLHSQGGFRLAGLVIAALACIGSLAPLAWAQQPSQPTKEYVRAGGKLIAIEIPGSGGGGGVQVVVTPSSVPLGPSGTAQFNAQVTGTGNTAVNWSLNPMVGSISSSGLYTAPASIPTPQNVTVRATSVADGSAYGEATVNLQPPPAGPSLSGFTPTSPTAQEVTFSMTAHGGGSPVIQLRLYIGWTGVDQGACLVLYDRFTSQLHLRGDGNGDSWIGHVVMGQSQTVENSQCRVYGIGSSAFESGNNVTIAIRVLAKAAFGGPRLMRVYLDNQASQTYGYETVGTWTVPGGGGSGSVTPATASAYASQMVQLTATTAPPGQTVNWTISPVTGYIHPNTGLYEAPGTISTQQTVTATARLASNNNLVGTSTITLKPNIAGGGIPVTKYVLPSGKAGIAEIFRFDAGDPQGANTVDELLVRMTYTGTDQNACSFRWSRAGNTVELFNDAGTQLLGPLVHGAANLSNSACTLVGASFVHQTWGPTPNDNFELILGIGFHGTFANATRWFYMRARDNTGKISSWSYHGHWNFPIASAPPSHSGLTKLEGHPTVVQKFSVNAIDPDGIDNINDMQFVVTNQGTMPADNTCHLYYFFDSELAVMLADNHVLWAGQGDIAPGRPDFSNSQCDFIRSESEVLTVNGTTKAFRPKIRLKGGFATTKNIYVTVSDESGQYSGYQYVGTFNVGSASNEIYLRPFTERDPLTGERKLFIEVEQQLAPASDQDRPAEEEE